MPLVTVIIPTYNRASLLPRAIRSVLAQTHRPLELIVVDDGSVDDTEAVVRGFADPCIKYIRHPHNQGQCAAINTGIRAAKGDFVCFLDSDDEWDPAMIQKQLDVFSRSDRSTGVVYTLAGTARPDGSLAPSHVSHLQGPIYRDALAQGYVAHSIAILVRRSCFDKIGLFDTRFLSFQDDDICFRLAREYAFGLVPEMLAIIHPGAEGQLTRDRRPYARGWRDLLRKHEVDILKLCGPAVLARHYVRSGLLFLDAGDRTAARASFARALGLRPGPKALAGVVISMLPRPEVWLTLYRSRPHWGGGTRLEADRP